MNDSATYRPEDRPSIPLSWAEEDRFRLLMCRAAVPGRTRRYSVRRRDRARQLARRIARSPLAADVRRAYRAAFWPAVAASGLIAGLYLIHATRGSYVAWDGVHTIPTGGTR